MKSALGKSRILLTEKGTKIPGRMTTEGKDKGLDRPVFFEEMDDYFRWNVSGLEYSAWQI
jgi:hypothetical protein